MKRKIKRTIISWFLIVCLLVNVVPAVTFAEGTVAEETKITTGLEDLLAGVVSVEEFYGNLDSQTVPEIIGYDYAVSKAHVQRLYEKEGDHLDTVIFRNADGTETAYVFDYPVKYVDAKGAIRDITLDIADSAVVGEFETANSSAVTTFSRNLSDGIALRGNNTTLYPIYRRKVRTLRGRAQPHSRLILRQSGLIARPLPTNMTAKLPWQHYDEYDGAYRPFLTVMEFDVTASGVYL